MCKQRFLISENDGYHSNLELITSIIAFFQFEVVCFYYGDDKVSKLSGIKNKTVTISNNMLNINVYTCLNRRKKHYPINKSSTYYSETIQHIYTYLGF